MGTINGFDAGTAGNPHPAGRQTDPVQPVRGTRPTLGLRHAHRRSPPGNGSPPGVVLVQNPAHRLGATRAAGRGRALRSAAGESAARGRETLARGELPQRHAYGTMAADSPSTPVCASRPTTGTAWNACCATAPDRPSPPTGGRSSEFGKLIWPTSALSFGPPGVLHHQVLGEGW